MAVITGKITNNVTGKPIYNAHVFYTDKMGKPYSPLVGTVTDFDGNFSFDSLGGYYLKVTHVGYSDMVKPIDLSHFQSGGDYLNTLNFQLIPTAYNLPEVVIHGKNTNDWMAKNKGSIFLLSGIAYIGYVLFHHKR